MEAKKREEFLAAYNDVFSPNGDIKACGRKKCMELISICSKCSPSNCKSFGDLSTGIMKVSHIKEFVEEDFPEVIFRERFLHVFDENGNLKIDPEKQNPMVKSLLIVASKLDSSFSQDLDLPARFDEKTQNALKTLYHSLVSIK